MSAPCHEIQSRGRNVAKFSICLPRSQIIFRIVKWKSRIRVKLRNLIILSWRSEREREKSLYFWWWENNFYCFIILLRLFCSQEFINLRYSMKEFFSHCFKFDSKQGLIVAHLIGGWLRTDWCHNSYKIKTHWKYFHLSSQQPVLRCLRFSKQCLEKSSHLNFGK